MFEWLIVQLNPKTAFKAKINFDPRMTYFVNLFQSESQIALAFIFFQCDTNLPRLDPHLHSYKCRTFNFGHRDKTLFMSLAFRLSSLKIISPDNLSEYLILPNHSLETRIHFFWSVLKSRKLHMWIQISAGNLIFFDSGFCFDRAERLEKRLDNILKSSRIFWHDSPMTTYFWLRSTIYFLQK